MCLCVRTCVRRRACLCVMRVLGKGGPPSEEAVCPAVPGSAPPASATNACDSNQRLGQVTGIDATDSASAGRGPPPAWADSDTGPGPDSCRPWLALQRGASCKAQPAKAAGPARSCPARPGPGRGFDDLQRVRRMRVRGANDVRGPARCLSGGRTQPIRGPLTCHVTTTAT